MKHSYTYVLRMKSNWNYIYCSLLIIKTNYLNYSCTHIIDKPLNVCAQQLKQGKKNTEVVFQLSEFLEQSIVSIKIKVT